MLVSTRIFAVLTLLAAALVYSITHLRFPEFGYEGTLLLGGILVWISIISGLIVFAGAFLNYRRHNDMHWRWPVATALGGYLLVIVAIYA